jgi:hypothetical protein
MSHSRPDGIDGATTNASFTEPIPSYQPARSQIIESFEHALLEGLPDAFGEVIAKCGHSPQDAEALLCRSPRDEPTTYRVERFESAIVALRALGLDAGKRSIRDPNGPCYTFRDPTGCG